jgi:hypothetical protein
MFVSATGKPDAKGAAVSKSCGSAMAAGDLEKPSTCPVRGDSGLEWKMVTSSDIRVRSGRAAS